LKIVEENLMRPRSIFEIAQRAVEHSQGFDAAVREFLDAWQRMDANKRRAALRQEPSHVGRVYDAYLGALTEHLARIGRLEIPAWTEKPSRFLDQPFFSGGLETLKPILLVESPLAFRRRLIFISANGLSRPQRAASEEHAPA